MTMLVTGVTGFIGFILALRLFARGDEERIIANSLVWDGVRGLDSSV